MSIPAPKNYSPQETCANLNRLIVADLDEGLVLDAAALVVHGSGCRLRLLHQALRRGVFRADLGKAIVALGGIPAQSGSYGARVKGVTRWIRQVLVGGHEGDAYASCARATAKTSAAYVHALRSTLPGDVRFGVERELSDSLELVRLRFGARAEAPAPGSSDFDRADARVLEAGKIATSQQ
jgi:hypothetical protein